MAGPATQRPRLPGVGRLGLVEPTAAADLATLGWDTDNHVELLWSLSRAPDADAALVAVNGVSGVEVNTEKVWQYAEEIGQPVLFHLTKMDRERADLERELNNWIGQYVADMDDAAPGVRSRRPLRKAQIVVSDVEGQPGWYRVNLKVRPHFKYMGADFTLSLVGKLDKE